MFIISCRNADFFYKLTCTILSLICTAKGLDFFPGENFHEDSRKVGCDARVYILLATVDGILTALDFETGQKCWSTLIDTDSFISSSLSKLEVWENGNRIWLVPSLDGAIFKYDKWKLQPLPINVDSLLMHTDNLDQTTSVYGGKFKHIFGIDLHSGDIYFKCAANGCNKFKDGFAENLLIVEEIVQNVRAIENMKGEQRWHFQVTELTIKLPVDLEANRNDSSSSIVNNTHNALIPRNYSAYDIFNDFTMSLHSGYVGRFNKSSLTFHWLHKTPAPIVDAWYIEGNNIHLLDPFDNESGFFSIETQDGKAALLFLGTYRGQLFIKQSKKLKFEAFSNAMSTEVHDVYSFPVCKQKHISTVVAENKSSALVQLDVDLNEYGSYFYINFSLSENATHCIQELIIEEEIPVREHIWFETLTTASIFLAVFYLCLERTAFKKRYANASTSSLELSHSNESHTENHMGFTSRFQEDFDMIAVLGKGGFGVVMEVRNKIDDCHYAVKRIRISNKLEKLQYDKVMREVKALAKLDHPGIVRYFNAWIETPPVGWQEKKDHELNIRFSDIHSLSISNSVPTSSKDSEPPSEKSMQEKIKERLNVNPLLPSGLFTFDDVNDDWSETNTRSSHDSKESDSTNSSGSGVIKWQGQNRKASVAAKNNTHSDHALVSEKSDSGSICKTLSRSNELHKANCDLEVTLHSTSRGNYRDQTTTSKHLQSIFLLTEDSSTESFDSLDPKIADCDNKNVCAVQSPEYNDYTEYKIEFINDTDDVQEHQHSIKPCLDKFCQSREHKSHTLDENKMYATVNFAKKNNASIELQDKKTLENVDNVYMESQNEQNILRTCSHDDCQCLFNDNKEDALSSTYENGMYFPDKAVYNACHFTSNNLKTKSTFSEESEISDSSSDSDNEVYKDSVLFYHLQNINKYLSQPVGFKFLSALRPYLFHNDLQRNVIDRDDWKSLFSENVFDKNSARSFRNWLICILCMLRVNTTFHSKLLTKNICTILAHVNEILDNNDSWLLTQTYSKPCKLTTIDNRRSTTVLTEVINKSECDVSLPSEKHSRQVTMIEDSAPAYLYIQMQLCRKESLRNWLQGHSLSRNYSEVMRIFYEIVDAVDYVHACGLMHRDLNPSNIYFSFEGAIKIGDFGLATSSEIREHNSKTCCEEFSFCHTSDVGTELYISPEQGMKEEYDFKTDIYSLGIILFELLVPFKTTAERYKVLLSVRKLQFPLNFIQQHPEESVLVRQLLTEEPHARPTANEIKEHPLCQKYSVSVK